MHRYHKIHIRCGDTIFLKIYRIRYLQHTYLNISLQIYKSKLRTYFLDIAKMKIKIIYHCLHKSLLHIFYKYRSSINVICFLKSSITRTIFIFDYEGTILLCLYIINANMFHVIVLDFIIFLKTRIHSIGIGYVKKIEILVLHRTNLKFAFSKKKKMAVRYIVQ